MIDEALRLAIYTFSQALLFGPVDIGIEQAVDQIEKRVEFNSKPDDVTVKLIIECVLKEVQYRVSNHHLLTKDRENLLVRRFRATNEETERLLRQPHVTMVCTIRTMAHNRVLV